MKLHNLDNSPYSARVRMQVRHKALPVEIVAPPVPLRTPEFAARYPLGKLPLLELDDGRVIAESAVILRYLEACFPAPALLPASPLAQAADGMLGAFADLHLAPALFPLFGAVFSGAQVDAASQLDVIRAQLKKLERLLAQWPVERGALTLGAISLSTVLAYTLEICEAFAEQGMLADAPLSVAWWQALGDIPAVSGTLEEMLAAHRRILQRD
jgi:glutathione S-transferase